MRSQHTFASRQRVRARAWIRASVIEFAFATQSTTARGCAGHAVSRGHSAGIFSTKGSGS